MELTEAFLAQAAGWEVVKEARAMLAQGMVLSANWTPPVLKGVVQEGPVSLRAGLVIRDAINIENLCGCRASRQWGTICAHSVAVGIRYIRGAAPAPPTIERSSAGTLIRPPPAPGKRLRRAESGPGVEPLEIQIIFPPNLTQAMAKGRVMLCFEGRWARGAGPLGGLPANISFSLSPQDTALLDHLETVAGGDTPSMAMLSNSQVCEVLNLLFDHPRVTLGKKERIEIQRTPFKLPLRATLEPSGEIRLEVPAGNEIKAALLHGEKSWWIGRQETRRVEAPKSVFEAMTAPVVLSRARVPVFLSTDWPGIEAACDIEANFTPEQFSFSPLAPRFILALFGGLAQLQAQLQCAYGQRILTLGISDNAESFWLPDETSPTRYSTRSLDAEREAIERLRKAGFGGPDAQGRWQLLGQGGVLAFFARLYPRLQKEWEVTLEARLEQSLGRSVERIEPRFEVISSGEQWFDLQVSFNSSGGERFSAADIQRLVLTGQNHARLSNGKFALIDTGAVEEFQEVLLDCAPEQREGGYRVENNHAGFLEATIGRHPSWAVKAPAAWRERAALQRGEIQAAIPPLGALEETLRPYQKQGVAWLCFLRRNHFGGILADEMGLGKTLQTLAFLQAVILPEFAGVRATLDSKLTRSAALVVCPTSLVFNWEAEARTFTPALRVLALHGPRRRAQFDRIAHSDLVITSYALARRDAEFYRDVEFDTVVLDEAQHIKNRQTQNARAVKALRSKHRVVLTGTPLENSVLDLWSIFDFLMPGYLGEARDFRDRYELPIVRDRDLRAQERLARRVRPFLLRRLKRDVAKDLPEKIEQVAFCELTDDQKAVYTRLLETGRREAIEASGQGGTAKARMAVLTVLLRLRQVCCDLRLLDLEGVEKARTSGKVEMFAELLEEILDGGHRVLVFSQFTSMLALLREHLTSQSVDYCYLDGSTTDRKAVVERFQNNAAIPVFLISLKAGGVGLNLTGADTVIHFDPWWNPAVEDQAADRAHRIGQKRVVTNFKLITRGTVEEKILNLQKRKREWSAGLFGDEAALTGQLTWEELQELLS